MPSNLPNIQKENWALNEVVMPTDTNNWGSSINKLTTAIPIYASTGDFYTVQSYENNVISLTPLTYIDGSQNQIPLTYIDGMNIVFKSTFNNQSKCSININGLGVKQIKNIDNTLLSADKIKQGYYVNLKYDLLQDCFYLNSLSITNEMGGGLELCDIGMALYVDETKGLRRYLNGQIVDINTNTQAFLDRLKQITALHPSLLCTEDEWQTAKTMSAFGQVGKFVFNYADDGVTVVSVRIPRVVNIQGVFDLQNLGLTVEAGLPNITGVVTDTTGYTDTITTGFVTRTSQKNSGKHASGSGIGRQTLDFDASRSSSIYGNSNTVQQESIQYPYFIQIATGQETENNIINDIELNNPFSLFDSKYSDHELNNISWLKSEGQWNVKSVYPTAYDKLLKVYNGTETVEGLSVKLSTEDYTDYDFVLNTSDETFRLPKLTTNRVLIAKKEATADDLTWYNLYSDGWLEQGGYYSGTYSANGTISLVKAFKNTTYTITGSLHSMSTNSATYRASAIEYNDTARTTSNFTVYGDLPRNWRACGYAEIPTENNYLYFYVGETVQNANLIDAGRIEEQLANKQDKCVHITETYVNGTSGYRIWSDGYCEQWGRLSNNATVTFLKAFKNADYCLTAALLNGTSTATYEHQNFSLLTNTSFDFHTYDQYGVIWKASGYIT